VTPSAPYDHRTAGGYTLHDYGMMFGASVQSTAYCAAIAAAIRPGDVVVELGAGLGLHSLLMCRAGARRVYAIEASPMVRLGPLLAADNGVGDQVVWVEDVSTRVTLPERADVIVADLRGVLPFFAGAVDSLADARRRFLKPDGVLIPARDTLWAAVAVAPDLHDEIITPWTAGARGLDLHRAVELAVNAWHHAPPKSNRLISDAVKWGTLEYDRVENGACTGTAHCTARESATAHGVLVWFDAELMPGIGFSCAPWHAPTMYGQAFFPWPAAMALAEGDTVDTTFHVTPGAVDSVWTWTTRVADASGRTRAEYRQSTFLANLFPRDEREQRADTHVPRLAQHGEITRDVLHWLDGRRTLGDVATLLQEKYPATFTDWNAALDRAADIAVSVEERGRDPR
jgi:protein arginine N-methyltransferase 1